ncbi:unnamed protein product [Schistosoma bovis]|nr:unnamed protein product [Schistosoma bovis]
MRISNETKVILNLDVLALSVFISVCMSFFISDQFVYYSCLSEQGIDYWLVNKSDVTDGLQAAQKKAAFIQSLKNFLGIGTGIFSTLIIGYLSDNYGRQLTLGIIILGEALRILALGIIVFFNFSPWSLIVSELLEGSIGGGLLSISAQLFACIADLTQKSPNEIVVISNENMDSVTQAKRLVKKRWFLFTLLDGVITCGMAFANALTGFMIQHYRFYITMLTCIAFLIPSVITLFLVPETSVKTIQVEQTEDIENSSNELCITAPAVHNETSKHQESSSNYSVHVQSENSCMNKLQIISKLPRTHIVIIIIIFMFSISGVTDTQYLFLYLMSGPFMWDAQVVGLFTGLRDVCCTFVSVLCVSTMVKFRKDQPTNHVEVVSISNRMNTTLFGRLKSVDQILLIMLVFFGFIIFSIYQIIMGIACTFTVPTANILVYFATIPRFVKGFQISILRTIISKWTEVSKQGMVMSVIAVMERLGLLISVVALPVIYAATVSTFKGSVFFVCASFTILEALIVLILPVYAPNKLSLES